VVTYQITFTVTEKERRKEQRDRDKLQNIQGIPLDSSELSRNNYNSIRDKADNCLSSSG